MPPFRDFGTDVAAAGAVARHRSMLSYCNWVQAMEGNLDTSHISCLHQLLRRPRRRRTTARTARATRPTRMSMRIWAQDRAPRLEVQDTWYGFRYAGIRTTPNGHTHVRMTALHPARTPRSSPACRCGAGGGIFVPIDDDTLLALQRRVGMPRGQRTRSAAGGNAARHARPTARSAPARAPTASSTATVLPRERLPDRPRHAAATKRSPASRTSSARTWRSPRAWARSTTAPASTSAPPTRRSSACARLLIKAARDLANGIEPPATDPSLPYDAHLQRREDPGPGRRLARPGHRQGPDLGGRGAGQGGSLVSPPHPTLSIFDGEGAQP